jgi:IclR family transcriptional regulator, pca regulon regulatory protein
MTSKPFEESADYVQSLARGLQVLRAFDRELPSASLSQIAERIGLSRAVARRSLLTLQHLGYVGSRGRSFFLTPRVLELGFSYLSSLDLTELAQQSIEQLSQRVGESCSMAVLDGSDIVYVLRVPVRRVISVALGVGARLPAFVASMGRVMLADLPDAELAAWLRGQKFRAFTAQTIHTPGALKAELQRVQQQGYALVDRELEPGLCSIAVPVRAGDGHVVAGLNIGMAYSEDALTRAVRQMLPALQEARHAIEQAIRRGGWMPHMAMAHGYE